MIEPSSAVEVIHVAAAAARAEPDAVAVEEPLEIRVGFGPANDRARKAVSVTMRTPGQDVELAVGFLFTEGILAARDEFLAAEPNGLNVIRVDLVPGVR